MDTPIPNINQNQKNTNLNNVAPNDTNAVNTHHYNATPNPNFDPNNPPEFSPNPKGNAPQVHKQAISGLGIILIIIGIIFLGVLIGKVVSMFVNAGSSDQNQATTQSAGGCTTIDCCHQQGRCMAVSKSDPYACKTITECVECDTATCSYKDVDTNKCAGKPCGPTPVPSGTPPVTVTPKPGGTCAAVPGKRDVCLGNNFTGKCVDKIINGKPYACKELAGDFGYAVIDPETGKEATNPNKRPNCVCNGKSQAGTEYTWLKYEYGRWWCFDTHSPGVCIPNNDTHYRCEPGTCEPTGTVVETPTPTPTHTPTTTPSPTPTPTPTTTPTSTPTTTPSPTPSTTVPNTGLMDSPVALGSIFFIISVIAIYETLTGAITNKLLHTKASTSYTTSPSKLKFIIRVDNIKKTRQKIENRVKNDINSDK